jgi:predicted permease
LIACANVANLLLAQAASRQRELAIRHALGAARGRLIRQFVTEAGVLLALGGLGGIVMAMLGVRALVALAPATLPRLDDVFVSGAVLAFALGLAAAVAIGLGLVTAWRATRRDPRRQLADGGRSQAGGASTQRVGRAIVAMQMALTVVLLIGAALLGRSLQRVLAVDPGFRTEGIVAMDVAMPYVEGDTARARLAPFYTDLYDRLRTIGGVQDVAAATAIPLDTGLPDGSFAIVGPQDAPKTIADIGPLFARKDQLGTADFCAVSPDYFRAIGVTLKRGRLFDDHDSAGAAHAAVITESLARTRWPDQDPLGRTIEFGNMDGDLRLLTIVGVVADTHEAGLEQPPRPTVFVNLLQRPAFTTTVVMRATGDPGHTIAAARQILKSVAPDVPPRFRTFDDVYAAALGPRHFNLTLVAVFAGTALVLALAGIYGVMAYSVTERRREIGVRVALGATPAEIFKLVIGQGLGATAAGVAIGVAGALALTRTIESLLFDVTPTDPLTFAGVVALLIGMAALACFVPARRATRADPIAALRQD